MFIKQLSVDKFSRFKLSKPILSTLRKTVNWNILFIYQRAFKKPQLKRSRVKGEKFLFRELSKPETSEIRQKVIDICFSFSQTPQKMFLKFSQGKPSSFCMLFVSLPFPLFPITQFPETQHFALLSVCTIDFRFSRLSTGTQSKGSCIEAASFKLIVSN